jgi:hypothetical protein
MSENSVGYDSSVSRCTGHQLTQISYKFALIGLKHQDTRSKEPDRFLYLQNSDWIFDSYLMTKAGVPPQHTITIAGSNNKELLAYEAMPKYLYAWNLPLGVLFLAFPHYEGGYDIQLIRPFRKYYQYRSLMHIFAKAKIQWSEGAFQQTSYLVQDAQWEVKSNSRRKIKGTRCPDWEKVFKWQSIRRARNSLAIELSGWIPKDYKRDASSSLFDENQLCFICRQKHTPHLVLHRFGWFADYRSKKPADWGHCAALMRFAGNPHNRKDSEEGNEWDSVVHVPVLVHEGVLDYKSILRLFKQTFDHLGVIYTGCRGTDVPKRY